VARVNIDYHVAVASAENAVRLVEMWVLAPLRHRQFFSLAEANAALAEKIEEWKQPPVCAAA
jgi:hypothetical protein